jgi:class 3 adenylate cyclase
MRERCLAIVLLDIIGSTAFVQKVGAVKAARWLQYHDRLARSLIYKYEGREIDRSDGFLLSFDTIIDAVNFSLHYQREIPNRIKLNTRIGIHWGSIIEVKQDDLFVGVGAKRVELEGISKNIAARTMSLSRAGQVLLTKEAMERVRVKGCNRYTPAGTRYVCVGLYRFKGVRNPQEIYAVGQSIESLQPPKGSEKVKRLGGPKKIKSRARDKKVMEWVSYFFWRLGVLAILFWLWFFFQLTLSPVGRPLIGLDYHMPRYDAFIESVIDSYNSVTGKKKK